MSDDEATARGAIDRMVGRAREQYEQLNGRLPDAKTARKIEAQMRGVATRVNTQYRPRR